MMSKSEITNQNTGKRYSDLKTAIEEADEGDKLAITVGELKEYGVTNSHIMNIVGVEKDVEFTCVCDEFTAMASILSVGEDNAARALIILQFQDDLELGKELIRKFPDVHNGIELRLWRKTSTKEEDEAGETPETTVSFCPACGGSLGDTTTDINDKPAKKGDILVCGHCFRTLVYCNDDFKLRALTEEESNTLIQTGVKPYDAEDDMGE